MPKGIPNQQYTGEFKQMVVETMMQEKLRVSKVSVIHIELSNSKLQTPL